MKTLQKINVSEINCLIMVDGDDRSLDIYFTVEQSRYFLNLGFSQIAAVVNLNGIYVDNFLSEVDCREWADTAYLNELTDLVSQYFEYARKFEPKTWELRRKTALTLFAHDHPIESEYFFEHGEVAPMVLMDDYEISDLSGEDVDLSCIRDFELMRYSYDLINPERESEEEKLAVLLTKAASQLRQRSSFRRQAIKERQVASLAIFPAKRKEHLELAEYAEGMSNQSLEAYLELRDEINCITL